MRSNRKRPVHRSRRRSRSRRLSQSRNMRRSSSRKKMSRRGRTDMRMGSPRRKRSRSRQVGGDRLKRSDRKYARLTQLALQRQQRQESKGTSESLPFKGTGKVLQVVKAAEAAAELNQLNKLVTKIYEILSKSDSEEEKEAAEKISKALLNQYCIVRGVQEVDGDTAADKINAAFNEGGLLSETTNNYLVDKLLESSGGHAINKFGPDDSGALWPREPKSEAAEAFCQLLIEIYLLDREPNEQKNLLSEIIKKLESEAPGGKWYGSALTGNFPFKSVINKVTKKLEAVGDPFEDGDIFATFKLLIKKLKEKQVALGGEEASELEAASAGSTETVAQAAAVAQAPTVAQAPAESTETDAQAAAAPPPAESTRTGSAPLEGEE